VKSVTCARLFEAEAMRDGRLAGDELASFARHATGCPACRREVQALEELADVLCARAAGDAPADELHGLRERTRLLAAFDATLVSPVRRTPRWRWVGGAAGAAMAMAAATVWLMGAPDHAKDDVKDDAKDDAKDYAKDYAKKAPSPAVVVQAGAATVWTKSSDGARDRIVLERGDLWIRVDHSRQKAGLVVALPDGELEDAGTTFTVSVADGQTARIGVQEGSVILRLAGRPAVTIGGGQTWRATPSARAAAALDPLPRGAPAIPGLPATVSAHAERTPHEPIRPPAPAALTRRAPAPATGVVSAAAEADPAVDFRAAVAALDGGADREAAAAFTRFLVEHAQDPRAEDAAYLRVVAFQRCGAADETRRAARMYLQRFPRGFRRTEIEPLAR